ncbi:MAG: hypothetical protein M3P34_06530 [Actinomycetota bacterium]|nr:hypothetical protein [Actinomycetota bacterium]
MLPYIFVMGLLAAYELAFIRIDWKSEAGRWARTRAKLVLLMSFHVRAREVGAFSGPWQFKLASTTSFREGRRVVAEFREAQLDAEREADEKEARLARYAGVNGVDDKGGGSIDGSSRRRRMPWAGSAVATWAGIATTMPIGIGRTCSSSSSTAMRGGGFQTRRASRCVSRTTARGGSPGGGP